MTAGHWDSLPLFALVDGAEFGPGLSDQQAEFLAREHRIVVLGKWVGRTRHGSTEAGNAVALRRLKELNPAVQVLCFWAVNDQFSDFYESSAVGRVPRDFVLRSPAGGDYITMPHHPDIFAWNTANPALREWWVSTIVARLLGEGYDGVHVDGIKQYVMRSHVHAAVLGEEPARDLAAGVGEMLAGLRTALAGSGKLIVYNGIKSSPAWTDGGARYLDAGLADGVLLESFGGGAPPSHEPAWMVADMDLALNLARHDRTIVFGTRPEAGRNAGDSLQFSLACFLCCAGPRSYFRFPLPGLGRERLAPYLRPIGPPRSPAERFDDGTRFRRDFEHVSVDVNVSSRAVRIDWAADG
jgi:hypothetical protein